jgi:hypothetical protein
MKKGRLMAVLSAKDELAMEEENNRTKKAPPPAYPEGLNEETAKRDESKMTDELMKVQPVTLTDKL